MPGQILRLTSEHAIGWASHPRLPGYCPLVHLAHRSVIVRSVVADQPPPYGEDGHLVDGHGFTIELARLGFEPKEARAFRFLIGETDEIIPLPSELLPAETGVLTLEDILAQAHGRRHWITGQTYVEAAAAGLRTDTIVDMLYRDYLGRPGDPNGLAHYASSVDAGTLTFDDIRRSFVDADEYRMRRKYVDSAPGSIFSQRIVLAAAPGEQDIMPALDTEPEVVEAHELLALDGDVFVSACYRRILRKDIDPAGLSHYRHQLARGVSKTDILRHIAAELEAITAGVTVAGLDDILADAGE